jgi:hypothetical protein
MKKLSTWTLNKLVVLLVLGSYFMFMMELRFEHMDELGDHWQAWIPIIFSAVMVIGGIVGLWLWEKGGRKVLFWGFTASLIVGILGVWFHTKGKPLDSARVVIAAWQAPIVKHHRPQTPAAPAAATSANPPKKKKKPKPPLAPLAFVGMGLLGMLACRERFIDSP